MNIGVEDEWRRIFQLFKFVIFINFHVYA